MNTEKFFEELGKVDNKYIIEAEEYKVKTKNHGIVILKKFVSAAACLCVLIAACFGIYASVPDSVTLENGEKLSFAKSSASGTANIDLDVSETKEFTLEMKENMFPGMNADGWVVKLSNNTLNFEGEVNGVKTLVWTDNQRLLDTIIDGREKETEINGVTVKAGRFFTDFNSKGKRNVIYYAEFTVGDNVIYLENGGSSKDKEEIKRELADVLYKIIANENFDLSKFK